MNSRIFLSLVLMTINTLIYIQCAELTSIEQKCVLRTVTIKSINNNSLDKTYLQCGLTDVTLFDENAEKVSTVLPSNDSSAVTSVLYEGSSINYIPNNLFTEFPNLEQLIIRPNQDLVELRPHYFKNAKHLGDLNIEKNVIATLHAKVFEEAENLESINLQGNTIETVHIFAFYGLKRLQRVNLANNNIKKLHPSTFSWLGNLVYLNLTGTQHCVNQNFNLIDFAVVDKTSSNDLNDLSEFNATDPQMVVEILDTYTTYNKFKDVEAAIHDNGCNYTLEDLQDIKTSNQIVDVKMNDFSSTLKNLTKEFSVLQGNYSNLKTQCTDLQKNYESLLSQFNDLHNNYESQSIINVRSTGSFDDNNNKSEEMQTEDLNILIEKIKTEILQKLTPILDDKNKQIKQNTDEINKLNKNSKEPIADDSTKNLMIFAIFLLIVLSCMGGFFVYLTVSKILKAGDNFQRDPAEVKCQIEVFEEKSLKMEEVDLNEKL